MTPPSGGLRPPLGTETCGDARSSRNVVARLLQHAAERPSAIAVYEPKNARGRRRYVETTFRELADSVQNYAAGLQRLGITRGMRVTVMVPPSRELIRVVYALLGLGAVMVLVDPGMGIRNLGKCLDEAQPEAFLGIWKAQVARRLFGWAKSTLKISLTISLNASGETGRLAVPVDERSSSCFFPQTDDPAAILFTSGSTGVPKGAVYTHGIFSSQVEQLHSIFGIEPGDIDLCTFPLFALFAPALGMTSIIPRMDFTRPAKVEPREILEPAREFGVTNLFGSPALINRVGRAANPVSDGSSGAKTVLPTIRRVLSAGAPVSSEILERFAKIIPAEAQLYTPYGATESLPVAVIGSREVLEETRHKTAQGAGTCVGKPVLGIDVKIIRISDEPISEWSDGLVLPTGEIGEIGVYGSVVTQEYFRRPDLTALAKIPDPPRGRKWHRMGDVGYLDEQGRLWFCGRKSQRVVTPERTYFTEPVEGIFNTHPAVFRTALVGVARQGTVEPVLCVELEGRAKPPATKEIARELLEIGARYELTKSIRELLFHKAFPVDIRHNSKIFREKLGVWAQRRIAPGETSNRK